MAEIIKKIANAGKIYSIGGGSTPVEEVEHKVVTQEEFDVIPQEEKVKNVYMIKGEAEPTPTPGGDITNNWIFVFPYATNSISTSDTEWVLWWWLGYTTFAGNAKTVSHLSSEVHVINWKATSIQWSVSWNTNFTIREVDVKTWDIVNTTVSVSENKPITSFLWFDWECYCWQNSGTKLIRFNKDWIVEEIDWNYVWMFCANWKFFKVEGENVWVYNKNLELIEMLEWVLLSGSKIWIYLDTLYSWKTYWSDLCIWKAIASIPTT